MSIRLLMLLGLAFALPAAATVPSPMPPGTAPVPAPAVVEQPAPPPVRVLVVTTLGEIELELDPAAAPATVDNFLEYAREGHYNGTVFHRVIPGLLLQAGAFTPDLQQKPSRAPIANEAGNGLANLRGTIAAARDRGVADSATAQFFINLADNPGFDPQPGDSPYTSGYAVFGRVVHGMDVVDRIAAQPTAAQGPFPGWVPRVPVVIERVQVRAAGSDPAAAPADALDAAGAAAARAAGRTAGAAAAGTGDDVQSSVRSTEPAAARRAASPAATTPDDTTSDDAAPDDTTSDDARADAATPADTAAGDEAGDEAAERPRQ